MPLYKKTGQLLNNPLQLTAREEQVSSLRTHAGLCITERHYAVTRHDCSHSIITHSARVIADRMSAIAVISKLISIGTIL